MRVQHLFFHGALLLLAACSTAGFQPNSAEKSIRSAYKQLNRDYLASDFKGMASHMTEDCTIKKMGEPATLRKVHFLSMSRAMSHTRKVVSSNMKVKSVHPSKGNYVAVIEWVTVSRAVALRGQKTKPSSKPERASQVITDTWTQVKGKWMLSKRLIGDD